MVADAADGDDDSDADASKERDTSDPGCEPNDPYCEEECYYGEEDYMDAIEHFEDELVDVRDGFDRQKVIREGTKYFDTETGNFVYTLGSDVVVTDVNGNPRTAYENNSRATTERKQREGRWQPCNE